MSYSNGSGKRKNIFPDNFLHTEVARNVKTPYKVKRDSCEMK